MSLADARRIVALYVAYYNQVRLHSALGYVTPTDKLAGREQEIFAARDGKLHEARQGRQVTIEQVLRYLGHLEHLRGSGAQRRGPCPVQGSSRATSRSFSVNLAKNVFRCFCPECGAKGNVLDLPSGNSEEEPVVPRVTSAAPCPTATGEAVSFAALGGTATSSLY